MRAYRSPGETRFVGVFSAATTRMQSAGHAAAQSEQPTHFSSPESSKRWSLCRPLKRGYTGVFSSGYSTVAAGSMKRPSVVKRPRAVSPNVRQIPRRAPGAGVRWTTTTSWPGFHVETARGEGSADISVRGHHEDGGHEGVHGRQREEHLPAEAHQLVVAQARERGAHPDEQERNERHLREHNQRGHPAGWGKAEGKETAAEEDG